MLHEFSRAELLLGAQAIQTLAASHVAVFGVGGVGSFACEALARAGVGELTLIDNDTVALTNRNRQLIALASTSGQPKVDAMRARIADINPRCTVHALRMFYTPDSAGNKLDPTRFEVTDIYKTSVCPLARVIRLECKKRRIKRLKVVYSREEARTPLPSDEQKGTAGRAVPGSVSFVPPVAGMILAGECIKDLTGVR